MSIVYLALGSNLGDSISICQETVRYLKNETQCSLLSCSSLYRSTAMILPGQEPQDDYINAVIKIETDLIPLDLLKLTQEVENRFGRERKEKWGARTLDIDILLYDNIEICTPQLTIPHYGLEQRAFVLYPLQEIEAHLKLPNNRVISELIRLLPSVESEGLQKLAYEMII